MYYTLWNPPATGQRVYVADAGHSQGRLIISITEEYDNTCLKTVFEAEIVNFVADAL